MKTTLQHITEALAGVYDLLRGEYKRQLIAQRDEIYAQLETDEWNKNKSFDYPYGAMSRVDYAKAVARYNLCSKYAETDAVKHPFSVSGGHNAPHYVTKKPNTAAMLQQQADKMARAALDGYCLKLTGKVEKLLDMESSVIEVKYSGNKYDPWGFSHIEVYTDHQERQVWQTKMIVNVSCLGKVFNQWPTRITGRFVGTEVKAPK